MLVRLSKIKTWCVCIKQKLPNYYYRDPKCKRKHVIIAYHNLLSNYISNKILPGGITSPTMDFAMSRGAEYLIREDNPVPKFFSHINRTLGGCKSSWSVLLSEMFFLDSNSVVDALRVKATSHCSSRHLQMQRIPNSLRMSKWAVCSCSTDLLILSRSGAYWWSSTRTIIQNSTIFPSLTEQYKEINFPYFTFHKIKLRWQYIHDTQNWWIHNTYPS